MERHWVVTHYSQAKGGWVHEVFETAKQADERLTHLSKSDADASLCRMNCVSATHTFVDEYGVLQVDDEWLRERGFM